MWSILGSALILFATYFQVQVSVAINDWYGPFYDLIQAALAKTRPVTLAEFFGHLASFAGIALVAVTVSVITRFFVSHYVFRWRTAMNGYYMDNWGALRRVEGAAQRVQEDTMRFASITEGLGVSLIDSVMTLIAFLPVLLKLSANVTELPLIGAVPYALVWVAVIWSLFGTGFLALIGIRLPGLEFRNQRVEAAYRKELVYGEDDGARAAPQTVSGLFADVRKKIISGSISTTCISTSADIFYLQTDNIFPLYRAGADHRGGQDHARRHEPDPQCLRPSFRSSFQYPGQFLDDDCRADVDLQAPARFRGQYRIHGEANRSSRKWMAGEAAA